MRVIGMIGQTPTTFSAEQLAAHILAKSGRAISQANVNHCANEIISHPGGNNAGGAINGVSYNNQGEARAIYHASRNRGGPAAGCSVFFADAGGGTAKLLAIGAHVGTAAGGPVYELDWVAAQDWGGSRRWRAGTRVTLP